MYRRKILPLLDVALQDTPVVLINGARQTGKTTLVEGRGRYFTFDEAATLSAATTDPAGFLRDAAADVETVVLDEVQFAPSLFPAIKILVDRDRRPGRFLLTGSANVLLLPRLSESLAGRLEILTLWPLSQSEIAGTEDNLIDRLFAATFSLSPFFRKQSVGQGGRSDLVARIARGGYPEPLSRPVPERRDAWFQAYLTTILQRDVREIAAIEGISQMPRLLALLASRSANLLNLADISRNADMSYTTVQRYMTLLQAAYLIYLLPAWSNNRGSRVIKSPKLLLTDTGLALSLLRVDEATLAATPALIGAMTENFAAMELIKNASWSQARPTIYHWRTTNRQEADIVLEGPGGAIVGMEIKASATITSGDFTPLRALAAQCGDRFRRGVVLYGGETALPFGENLYALPLSALWQ